jgi:hypothetical protein
MCREWLGALENANLEFDQHRAKWMEGTCTWIRETEEYQALKDDRGRQHLWAYGLPGMNVHSIIARTLKPHL